MTTAGGGVDRPHPAREGNDRGHELLGVAPRHVAAVPVALVLRGDEARARRRYHHLLGRMVAGHLILSAGAAVLCSCYKPATKAREP